MQKMQSRTKQGNCSSRVVLSSASQWSSFANMASQQVQFITPRGIDAASESPRGVHIIIKTCAISSIHSSCVRTICFVSWKPRLDHDNLSPMNSQRLQEAIDSATDVSKCLPWLLYPKHLVFQKRFLQKVSYMIKLGLKGSNSQACHGLLLYNILYNIYCTNTISYKDQACIAEINRLTISNTQKPFQVVLSCWVHLQSYPNLDLQLSFISAIQRQIWQSLVTSNWNYLVYLAYRPITERLSTKQCSSIATADSTSADRWRWC